MATAFSIFQMIVIMLAFIVAFIGISQTFMEPNGPRGEPWGIEREFADWMHDQ